MEKLLAILKTALHRIRSNLLEKEADVKQAVVSPILRALDWAIRTRRSASVNIPCRVAASTMR